MKKHIFYTASCSNDNLSAAANKMISGVLDFEGEISLTEGLMAIRRMTKFSFVHILFWQEMSPTEAWLYKETFRPLGPGDNT